MGGSFFFAFLGLLPIFSYLFVIDLLFYSLIVKRYDFRTASLVVCFAFVLAALDLDGLLREDEGRRTGGLTSFPGSSFTSDSRMG